MTWYHLTYKLTNRQDYKIYQGTTNKAYRKEPDWNSHKQAKQTENAYYAILADNTFKQVKNGGTEQVIAKILILNGVI